MLKQIPKELSPELLKVLMEMGHGDEIVIADGNYPAASHARLLVRQDGLSVPALLASILELFPIDTYVASGIALMEVVEKEAGEPAIWQEFKMIFSEKKVENKVIEQLERHEFYERGKKAYAILATGEEAIYANIILRKGVVK